MSRTIDVHSHILPKEFIELVSRDKRFGANVVNDGENKKIVFDKGFVHPVNERTSDIDTRLLEMNNAKIDQQVLSLSPRLFYYYADKYVANEVCVTCNNSIYGIDNNNKRFVGMGTVPLQDVVLAIIELNRIHNTLGFTSIEIGSEVNDLNLSDDTFIPFFEEVEKLGIFVFIHPVALMGAPYMKEYNLGPVLGHPYFTTAAIANLIMSGFFDRFPNIKIGLSHAGGYLPYQLGRLEFGFDAFKDTKVKINKRPKEYIKNNIYFDSITHSKESLEFLLNVVSSKNIIIGTDYPLYMMEKDPIGKIEELDISKEDKENIFYENAKTLLKI